MDFLVMSQNETIYDYPPHSHEMWEMMINIEGEGIAVIDDREYCFDQGTIFCIRPGTLHSKLSENGFMDGCVLVRDFCFKSESENVLVFHDDIRRTFYSLFKLAFDFPLDPSTNLYGERFLRSLVDAMQNLLSHWKDQALVDDDVLRVQKLLAAHVGDFDFDINQAINGTSYSPNYFRKIFKDQCGCSPIQYYNRLKVQYAKQMILQSKSTMTIREIAMACGYEDPFYFSRLFKKIEGVSPMQFFHESTTTIPMEAEGYTGRI